MFSMQSKLNSYNSLKKMIFQYASIEEVALEVFRFQYAFNPVYRQYSDLMGTDVAGIKNILSIPFMPVELFKNNKVSCDVFPNEHFFESSGTTDEAVRSKHYVSDLELYQKSALSGFEKFYSNPSKYEILGLLPSYLERENASLVYMVDFLMKSSGNPGGFFLHDFEALKKSVFAAFDRDKIPFVIGVSFALLDFAEQCADDYAGAIFMETGGMKGRRKEMVRSELHELLRNALNVNQIHSEYGMTEMLSQAYSFSNGVYSPSDTMRVLVRDGYDPKDVSSTGKGLINIIDLANLGSCSFLATQDVGEVFENKDFIVSGRSDNSEIRGCNLMAGEW